MSGGVENPFEDDLGDIDLQPMVPMVPLDNDPANSGELGGTIGTGRCSSFVVNYTVVLLQGNFLCHLNFWPFLISCVPTPPHLSVSLSL